MLFPAAQVPLDHAIERQEQLTELYNGAFGARRERYERGGLAGAGDSAVDHQVDADALARSASDGARGIVRRFVGMSRATALHEVGDTAQARAVLERHAWPDEPQG